MSEITQLLERAAQGEEAATSQLLPMIYQELRALAHRQLAQQSPERTLATTALVHEAYVELFGKGDISWRNRARFYAYAASTMRNILVEHARNRTASKHLLDGQIANPELELDGESAEMLALDQALTQMAERYPRWARVVELRFFAGLTVEDTAAALDVDLRTVKRDWQKARAFINLRIGRGLSNDPHRG